MLKCSARTVALDVALFLGNRLRALPVSLNIIFLKGVVMKIILLLLSIVISSQVVASTNNVDSSPSLQSYFMETKTFVAFNERCAQRCEQEYYRCLQSQAKNGKSSSQATDACKPSLERCVNSC